MDLNIHPIFVHFPVALLTVYSLMELVRWQRLLKEPSWFYIKFAFATIGGLGALVAAETGSMAESAIRTNFITDPSLRQLVSMHSNFAKLTIAIFGLICLGYVFSFISRQKWDKFLKVPWLQTIWRWCVFYERWIVESPLIIVLALAGLIAITITGSLGGAIVYGPNIDPVVNFVYHLFF